MERMFVTWLGKLKAWMNDCHYRRNKHLYYMRGPGPKWHAKHGTPS